jgi:hypothetical protein
MSTHTQEQAPSTAVPAQAPTVEAVPVPAVHDHLRSHAPTCYWDHLECRWRCSGG